MEAMRAQGLNATRPVSPGLSTASVMGPVEGLQVHLTRVGMCVFRYGLALIFIWIGALKFTSYEAKAIEPLIMNSPVLAWSLPVMGLQALSSLIGIIEIVIGVLLAIRRFAPRLSALGSAGGIVTFLITLSFLFTTPGIWEMGYGFPALSGMPGQFLIKDLVLLGVAIWTAGEALQADWVRRQRMR